MVGKIDDCYIFSSLINKSQVKAVNMTIKSLMLNFVLLRITTLRTSRKRCLHFTYVYFTWGQLPVVMTSCLPVSRKADAEPPRLSHQITKRCRQRCELPYQNNQRLGIVTKDQIVQQLHPIGPPFLSRGCCHAC